MSVALLPGLSGAVVGAGAGLLAAPILRRLPAPKDDASDHDGGDRRAHGEDRSVDGEDRSADGDNRHHHGDEGSHDPLETPYLELAERRSLPFVLVPLGAVVCGVVGGRVGWDGAWPALVLLGAVGGLLGYVDAATRYLPTAIIGPSYVLVVALLVVGALTAGTADRMLSAVYGWLVFGGFYLLMWLVYPRGIGYGDVRLAGLLGLPLGYLGLAETITALYAGLVLGAVGGGLLILARRTKDRRYPFGPFMLVGALVGLVWGHSLGGWYASR